LRDKKKYSKKRKYLFLEIFTYRGEKRRGRERNQEEKTNKEQYTQQDK